ncbi:MAG: choice-of-anchor tandem repeat GloVer-containing protein, partial [Candidatus Korobacteraceae bacterium]
AQTFTVIHRFNETDGANPQDGLTIDAAGNLYGVTQYGGNLSSCPSSAHAAGCGVVFRMKPSGSAWVFSPLYNFVQNGADGNFPYGRVVFGPDGALYGTTVFGGSDSGGTVFRMTPPATVCKSVLCPWTETVLYSFPYANGNQPWDVGGLAFDQTGNLYGTTTVGGSGNNGVVFEMTPAHGSWTEQTLFNFSSAQTEWPGPPAGVVLDPQGNVYGTLNGGCDPDCDGTIFQLYNSGSGWMLNIIYAFTGNYGVGPYGGLIRDAEGNLYGSCITTNYGGVPAFELSPSDGYYNYSVLAYITGGLGLGPEADLVMDSAGNLYGTNFAGGPNFLGNVFKLSPTANGWVYTDLYDFNAENDGGYPRSNIVLDANGNLYGTASACGRYECSPGNYGVVWKITP